jgi:hypothetical protein
MTIENVAEDKGEVYDVCHHEADILIPEERVEVEYVMQEERSLVLISFVQPRSSCPLCVTLSSSTRNQTR